MGSHTSTATPTSYPLPAELTDHILSYHWDDWSSLTSCTLVCHLWHAIAQAHIYRRISLTDEKKAIELLGKLQAVETMHSWIRELRIHQIREDFTPWHLWISSPFPLIMNKLRWLHTLTFCDIQISLRCSTDAFFVLTQRSSEWQVAVRVLSSVGCRLTPMMLLPMIRCFPYLESLRFVHSRIPLVMSTKDVRAGSTVRQAIADKITFMSGSPHGRWPSLMSLCVVGDEVPGVQHIIPPACLCTLRDLHFDSAGDRFRHMSFVLSNSTAAASLQNLFIELPPEREWEPTARKLCLLLVSQCKT